MADYSKEEIKRIEDKWRTEWEKRHVYQVTNDTSKPKCYVLDMFPYPSGAGLHVGHPLGYIASDIYARFKRLKGFNVLHPMGFDAFGLPAEQYAIDHGIHPAKSTADNIANFKRQMAKIGFCYDWSREVQTCDPEYYRWTQWIFLQIFDSWFNRKKQKAERISELIRIFESEGNRNHPVPNTKSKTQQFGAAEWKAFSEEQQQQILMEYRLAYLAYTDVNWCEALGTVLANDEVINGVSYRGGHPVVKRQMRQWSLRITEYAERLLKGLDEIDFSESMKEIQRNWIGKSVGAEIRFSIHNSQFSILVFTTRPDTIFGVDFMVLAPEHELVKKITTPAQQAEVDTYLKYVETRSEVDRMAEVKKITGCFTGAYAVNPFNGRQVPVWISEYVLAGYGTGAIMAVPCGDERDHKFAKHFDIPITNIIGKHYTGEEANPTKEAILENSDFLNGLVMHKAIDVVIDELENRGIGQKQINYKMRDAGWSRQRYWGEPFPVVFKNDIPYPMSQSELPLELPPSNNFKPSGTGEGPLANLTDWINFAPGQKRDSNTMPTHAGAAWYFLRYMDPNNKNAFADKKALDYWGQVDVYVGGSEHAVAHLLYARLWVKILHDLGYLSFDEPFKKLINQGKILGTSIFPMEVRLHPSIKKNYEDRVINVSVIDTESKVKLTVLKLPQKPGFNLFLDLFSIKKLEFQFTDETSGDQLQHVLHDAGRGDFSLSHPETLDAGTLETRFIDIEQWVERQPIYKPIVLSAKGYWHWENFGWTTYQSEKFEEGPGTRFYVRTENEKMSKSYYNVVNPDDIIDSYGADTLRLYEMFLGPLEASKPWSTQGIDGVYKFLRRFWNLFHDGQGNFRVSDGEPTKDELKVLHRTLRKIEHDIHNFSFNTCVSEFMICANDLTSLKCNKRAVLEPLVIALAPFAPHLAEELWEKLGHTDFVLNASFPAWSEQYLVESSFNYPISINGKVRTEINFALDMPKEDIERNVLASEVVKKWTEGKPPKKVIVVPGKIVNVVV
ncbi:MAG: leucine--tRNA ligase [Cyclobacteriaceae bacterium]|jgi:leucyl-tRNA synthetase